MRILEYKDDGDIRITSLIGKRGPVYTYSTVDIGNWYIAVASQYGCASQCAFCKFGRRVYGGTNIFEDEILEQISLSGKKLLKDRDIRGLHLLFSFGGEPTWNNNVITACVKIGRMCEGLGWGFYPHLTTIFPKHNDRIGRFLDYWFSFGDTIRNGKTFTEILLMSSDIAKRNILLSGKSFDPAAISDCVARRYAKCDKRKNCLSLLLSGKRDLENFSLYDLFLKDVYSFDILGNRGGSLDVGATALHEHLTTRKTERGKGDFYVEGA